MHVFYIESIIQIGLILDLFLIFFFNNVKIIVLFLIYKPGVKVLLDIMLSACFLNT